MNREEILQQLARGRNLASQGFSEQAAETSASILERVLRWLLVSPTVIGLSPDAYLKTAAGIAEAVQATGKPVEGLGLGELIGVYRKSGLFTAISNKPGMTKFGEFQPGRFSLVNERRIGTYHTGKTLTPEEAEQSLSIVENALLETGLLSNVDIKTLRDNTTTAIVPMSVGNLPQPPYREFIGRKDLTDELVAVFKSGNPKLWAVQLTGEGGIGKTALAYHLAEKLFADGTFSSVIWFSGKLTRLTSHGIARMRDTPPGLPELCVAILDAFGEPIRPGQSDVAWLQRRAAAHLGAQRTLVVVDNWETIQDPTVTTFLEALPPSVALLSTTRVKVGGHKVVEITGLSVTEARALAASTLGIDHPASLVLTQSEDTAKELWRLSSGNPLAITLISAWVQEGLDLRTSLNKLNKHRSGLHEFLYQELFHQLSSVEKDILFVLATSTRPLAKPEIAFVLEAEEEDVETGVLKLLRFSMILDRSNLQESDDRFRVAYVARPLAATFALRKLDHDPSLRVKVNLLKKRSEDLRVFEEKHDDFIPARTLASDGDRFILKQCVEVAGSDDAPDALRAIAHSAPSSVIPIAFLTREYYRQGRIPEAASQVEHLLTQQIDGLPPVLGLAWRVALEGTLPLSSIDFLIQGERLAALDSVTLHKAATWLSKRQRFEVGDKAHTIGQVRCDQQRDMRQLSFFLVGRAENGLQWVASGQLEAQPALERLEQAERDLIRAREIGLTPSSLLSNRFSRLNELRRRLSWKRREVDRQLPGNQTSRL